jgi:flagellin-like hook-associated protein FlgL
LNLSGLTISNGSVIKNVSFAGATTVQDVLNDLDGAGLGVLAQINSAGTGINILNASQGTSLSIGENGGTTAAELGVQTFAPATALSSLNSGQGVQTAGGTTPDFQITAANGTTFSVALSSATTVQDVITAINAASGGNVTARLATIGSGLTLTDNTTGTGTLTLTALNNSTAAAQLGLSNPASGGLIAGTDPGAVQSNGIFGNLQKLIASLQTGSTTGMTEASQGLQTDTNRVIEKNGDIGAIEKELTDQQTALTTKSTSLQTFLSTLQDTDLPTAISEFQTLQTGLQASLQTAASTLQMSLLNYLS